MNNMDKIKNTFPRAEGVSQSGDTPTMPQINSDALFAGKRELAIFHSDKEYRLRITSKGKLILTK